MTAPALSLAGVTRRLGGRVVVDEVSFGQERGRVACLLGRSGCGKSTLLRLIAGLDEPDAGEIHLAGRPVSSPDRSLPPEARSVGLVFQDLALFPHLDALGNVAFGLRHRPLAERRARALGLLERFQVGHLAAAYPHTLSGGEQQRVAIARALAREPEVLLLDEPFSGLDGALRASVRAAVLSDLRALGTTVLMVTHDPVEALLSADDLLLMAEGRLLQAGSPAVCYGAPASVAAAALLGEVILLPAEVSGGAALSVLGSCPAPGLPDGPAELLLRPDALRLGPAGVEARVLEVGFGGSFHRALLEVGPHRLELHLPEPPPGPGSHCRIVVDPRRLRVFSRPGGLPG